MPEYFKDVLVLIEKQLVGLKFEELRKVLDLVHVRMDQATIDLGRSFVPGDKVQFKGKGTLRTGIVKKVHRKTVKVDTGDFASGGGGMWRVSPTYLEKVQT